MTYLLSELVDRSAGQRPDHVAFRCLSRAISYGELAGSTSQLANLLISEGVNPGDRVGIFLRRNLESAIAVHGVLKAGAAFVPIDPLTPTQRLRQIVEDCGIRHLVSEASQHDPLAELMKTENQIECILGGELAGCPARCHSWNTLSQYADRVKGIRLNERDLAYVMYTSGSTGRPKGIMHTHFSGASYAELSAATYGVTPEDCIGNHSPLHFDMSTFGYLTGPFAGATTVIIPAAYTKLAASLTKMIQDERISIWYSVPWALIQILLRGALERRDLRCLRWVLFGGEPFQPKHLEALRRALPGATFSNVYGPAEVNQCTFYHLPPVKTDIYGRKNGDVPAQIPIGKTWARTDALILTDDGPVEACQSVGRSGELLIRSPTMMKGYWSRPDLDAKAFYRRGGGTSRNDLFYRTGDMVRVEADGNLLFLGRRDRQIKLRGHRIEMDDVEFVLSAHPAVEEVGVFPLLRNGEVVEIGAAILLRQIERTLGIDDIMTFAAQRLPTYALPARVSLVESLPRTASGKVNRRELQREQQEIIDSGIAYED